MTVSCKQVYCVVGLTIGMLRDRGGFGGAERERSERDDEGDLQGRAAKFGFLR